MLIRNRSPFCSYTQAHKIQPDLAKRNAFPPPPGLSYRTADSADFAIFASRVNTITLHEALERCGDIAEGSR
jgi:hypothetical protein